MTEKDIRDAAEELIKEEKEHKENLEVIKQLMPIWLLKTIIVTLIIGKILLITFFLILPALIIFGLSTLKIAITIGVFIAAYLSIGLIFRNPSLNSLK